MFVEEEKKPQKSSNDWRDKIYYEKKHSGDRPGQSLLLAQKSLVSRHDALIRCQSWKEISRKVKVLLLEHHPQ